MTPIALRRLLAGLSLLVASVLCAALSLYRLEVTKGVLSCAFRDGEQVEPYYLCRDLEKVGIVTDCRMANPGGLGARAVHRVDFMVPPDDRLGQLLTFSTCEQLDKTVDEFDKLTYIAGKRQYASRRGRFFVQLNQDVSDAAASAIVSALGM